MKVKVLFAALISMFAGTAIAQDCTFFFPQAKGATWVRKGYDAKGNLQSVMNYKVDDVETLPSGMEVEADYVYTNAAGMVVNKGDVKAYCQNGEFFLDSQETLSSPDLLSDMNTNMDLTESFINYPDPSSADFNGDDAYFDEASIKVYDKNNRKNRKDISIYDREFVKTESVTTPAGTFDCAKVKYKMATRSPKTKETMTGYDYEWYSPNVGLVRTEQFDKNNVLQSYTVLEELK